MTRLQEKTKNNYLNVTPEILRIKSEIRGDNGKRLSANWTAHMSSKWPTPFERVSSENPAATRLQTRERKSRKWPKDYIFGAKRFEDPGAMYLEETIGIVRSLVE